MRKPKNCLLLSGSLFLLFLYTFYDLNKYYAVGRFSSQETAWEMVCYALLAGTQLAFVAFLSLKTRGVYTKTLLSLLFSAFYTMQVVFINAFFQYIALNALTGWARPLYPYITFVQSDLSYDVGIGAYRYHLVFGTFLVCALAVSVINSRKTFKKRAEPV